MKKGIKRMLAFLLTLAMCVSTTGVAAYAEETVVTDKVTTESGWDGVTTVNNYIGENFNVVFSLANYWEGGYNANVKVENTGSSVIENWYLSFALDNRFSSIWNAEVVSNENGQYVVKNANWNADIPVGGCVEFGISVNETFTGFPEEYKLLGENTQVQEEAYSVEYILDSDWGTGFTARMLLTNHTETVLEDWTLEFDFEREITNIWNGVIEAHEGNHYVIKNAGYNANVVSGSAISFGFNGEGGTAEDIPENCRLSSYTQGKVNSSPEDIDTELDTDSDGLPDYIEIMLESDTFNSDTDGDGLLDGFEFSYLLTDPTLSDTDMNGISDCDEDEDLDGLSNGREQEIGTFPSKVDSDSDGLSDGDEVTIYNTNPLSYDTDGDGLSDNEELKFGLNPNNSITNGITPDSERKFLQSADSEIKDDALLNSKSWLNPSITGNVPGDLSKNVVLKLSDNDVFDDNRAVLSDVIDVYTTYTYPLTLDFTYNENYNGDINSLCVASLNNNSLGLVNTTIDTSARIISGEILGEGTYFVINVDEFLKGLGIDVFSNVDTVKTAASRSMFTLEDAENMIMLCSTDDMENEVSLLASSAAQTMGKADVAFVLDVTGSMDDELRNVANNINEFVDELVKEYNIDANFSLITYNDYRNPVSGKYGTRIHKTNSQNWFTNVDSFKAEVLRTADEDCGWGSYEVFIDALGMAKHGLDWRKDAAKFVILLTDESGSYNNGYGYTDTNDIANALNEDSICVSVITKSSLQSRYNILWTLTDGLYANIDENFSKTLLGLAEKIGQVTNEGDWVLLDDYQTVRLNCTLDKIDGTDSDGDGRTDKQELNTQEQIDLTFLIEWLLNKHNLLLEMYKGLTVINVWKYESNPVLPDTDFDGINDSVDYDARNNHFEGILYGNVKDKKSSAQIEFNVDYRLLKDKNTVYKDKLSVFASLLSADIYTRDTILQNSEGYNNPWQRDVIGEDRWVQITEGFGTTVGSEVESEIYSLFGLKDVEKITINPNDYEEDKNDISEIMIGHRTVTYSDEQREIIIVAVRGTNGTIEEWTSNFDVGANTLEYESATGAHPDWSNKVYHHKGFDVAATRLIAKIEDYFERHSLDNDSAKSMLITGHSRGAAIANIIGAYFEQNDLNILPFTYTFATPNTTTVLDDVAKSYESIFNIINEDDIVALMPLTDWKFRRYGTDKSISVEAKYENRFGKRQEGTWEWLMGSDYNPNSNYNNTIAKLFEVADSREAAYILDTSEDGTINPHNKYHWSYEEATEELSNVEEELTKQGLIDYCKLSIGNDGAIKKYYVKVTYSPAFLMKTLANMAVYKRYNILDQKELTGGKLGYDVKGKYASAKASFAKTALGNMECPHTPETYYLIAHNGVKAID